LVSLPSFAVDVPANPSNYRSLLSSLNPGDTLVLAPGTYTRGLPLSNVAGTAQQPIVVRGPDDRSAVFSADDCCNTVQLESVAFVQIRNLTLDGAGTNGPFGVDARGTTRDVTIENLRIVNYGADQQNVGISTKGPAWNWVVRYNIIVGAGTGMYFGNSDGTAPFVNGLIEHNVVLDTLGYNVQIKHQQPRPTNVGLPTGDSRTIIRHNVFSKSGNSAIGAMARPNLLVGHFPLSGVGSNDRYEIYGNFFYNNPTEALFQGEGNVALYDNLFVNPLNDAVNIQAQNDRPRSVTVFHNTVVARDGGISVTGVDTNFTQRIVGNAVFAAAPVTGPNQQGNVTGNYAAAATFLNDPFGAIGALNLYPKAGQLSGTALDLAAFQPFTDGLRDFNGTPRTGTHRGAYEGSGTNPGWTLALSTKPAVGAVAAPAVRITADPATVSLQGSSTLSWQADRADTCTASGGWSGARTVTGSETVGPLAATSTYTLTCTGAGGSAAQSVTVAVASAAPPPTVTLTASPTSLVGSGNVTLTWASTNATGCTASGGWSGTRALSGTETVGPVSSSTAYTLACSGSGGSTNQTVNVTVTAPLPVTPPPVTPPVINPLPGNGGGGGGGGATTPATLLGLLAFGLLRRRLCARAA
jgi:hypothetical protein